MKVSVIIPTKSPGPLFRRVMAAVLTQETPWPFEVLVIDSGSSDATLDHLAGLNDPRLRVHRIAPAEFGHGRTRNLGMSLTTGEYAAFLTHDAVPADAVWLRSLVAAAEADPMIAGVFGRHIAHPGADPFTVHELEMHFAHFRAMPVARLDDRARYDRDPAYRGALRYFSDNNALLRRAVWQDIPYPDVAFAEDQAWARAIIEAGWAKAYADDAVVHHSHAYAPLERLRRSREESDALRRLFGERLCSTPLSLLRTWAALIRRDLRHAARAGLWRRQPGALLSMPLDHLMRALGHYLGSREVQP